MMERMTMFRHWQGVYARMAPDEAITRATEAVGWLRGRMLLLGRTRGSVFHGYNKRELNASHGQALGVHQQVLAGLTPSPGGV